MAQDYPYRELIIFNTAHVPLRVCHSIDGRLHSGASVFSTGRQGKWPGKPYTNVGDIRHEALENASSTSDIFCLFDDDDLYMPYHISQGVKRLLETGKEAWKPKRSLASLNDGLTFDYSENNLEASVFARMESIREFSFLPSTGDENLSWYDGINNRGGMVIDPTGVPSYGYLWGSKIARHKQSGDMRNPSNFENHKRASTDFGDGPLKADWPIHEEYERVYKQFPECAAMAKR